MICSFKCGVFPIVKRYLSGQQSGSDEIKVFSFVAKEGGSNHEIAVLVQNDNREVVSWSDFGIRSADGHKNDGAWGHNQTPAAYARPCIAGCNRLHYGADSNHQTQG